MTDELTDMDYLRAALANAVNSGLNLHDVLEMAMKAKNMRQFDYAVNVLGLTKLPPDERRKG